MGSSVWSNNQLKQHLFSNLDILSPSLFSYVSHKNLNNVHSFGIFTYLPAGQNWMNPLAVGLFTPSSPNLNTAWPQKYFFSINQLKSKLIYLKNGSLGHSLIWMIEKFYERVIWGCCTMLDQGAKAILTDEKKLMTWLGILRNFFISQINVHLNS